MVKAMKAHRGSRGISTLSLTSALYGVGVNVTPGRFTPGKDPVPTVQEAGWAPGPVCKVAENLDPFGVRPRSAQHVATPTELSRPLQSVGKIEDNADMPCIEYRL